MTGQKPATVNHLVLAATHTHTDSSGVHIGRELQPFMPPALNLRVLLPHLCPDNQLSRLLHGILLALFSHLGHSTSQPSPSLLIPLPFTANAQTFSDRKAFRKRATHQRFFGRVLLGPCCSSSHTTVALFCSSVGVSRFFTSMTSRLIKGAMHCQFLKLFMCIFRISSFCGGV